MRCESVSESGNYIEGKCKYIQRMDLKARCFISPYLEKSKASYYSTGQGTAIFAIGWVAG